MPVTQVLIRSPRTAALWAFARWSALAVVPLLLFWLMIEPVGALKTLWYVAIPLLPATFFLSTSLWRGSGTLFGRRMGDSLLIEMNPNWADNNVALEAFSTAEGYTGHWTWSAFDGPRSGGAFTAGHE